jgi:putative ABC transport system permease protein
MTFWTLIRRSLSFHSRAHFGVVLGAAVGSAALIGALVVGDSVRESLKDMALARLGKVETAMASGDRFFRSQLGGERIAAVLQLAGTAASQDNSARANHVQLLGVDAAFWQLALQPPALTNIPPDGVVLNEPLAQQLKVRPGDTVLLRVEKPSLLSRDAPISPQEDYSVAMRLKVASIVSDEQLGRFSLQANQVAPFNAFVNLAQLQEKIGQTNAANLLLLPNFVYDNSDIRNASLLVKLKASWNRITRGWHPGGDMYVGPPPNESASLKILERMQAKGAVFDGSSLRRSWNLEDAQLSLHALPNGGAELRSQRIFLDPPVVDAALKVASNAQPVLTYLVNELRDKDKAAPYSMVTAMGAPIVPPDMRDDEVVINEWLGDDFEAETNDRISLSYYVIGNGRALETRTNEFRVRAIVPLSGAAADRTLMPDFPGIADVETTQNWDAGFPIETSRIRYKDEEYWKQYRGTPKAFVTLAAGRKMWANRFGDCTAVRFPASAGSLETIRSNLLQTLDPASMGLKFEPVRAQALAASSQSVDFGGLFLGFSFFLIVAALLLMALLFQFGLEQRAMETGTLLALGFRPRQVRRLLLWEGAVLALLGGGIGAAGGIFYARAMLHGLTTVWRGAVGTSALHYHATPETLVMGTFAAALVAVLTIWLALRQQARRPARELLAEGAEERRLNLDGAAKKSRGRWVAIIAAVSALGLVGAAVARHETTSSETFFSAGALLLIAGLGFCAAWLGSLAVGAKQKLMTIGGLGLRGGARRRKRSLATIGLLACGAFLIVAVGAFRLDANSEAAKPSSGTGGFALLGESTLPVTYDLNGNAGRDFYGLQSVDLTNVNIVPFRVRDGDEASCLNLNRAQTPRLLGVNPEQLNGRFTFSSVMKGLPAEKPWLLLKRGGGEVGDGHRPPLQADEVAAIGDENSIIWAMGKKVGDTLDYTDERGRVFKLRLVGAVANSILQGNLLIDEAGFVKRFPDESGYRMFLIDAPSNSVAKVSTLLGRALQDAGLELTPAAVRLNAFNAVQNTYLGTFQVLGGLGLLLGSAGLGVVVLRNVQERRGELALLLAVGFRRRALQWLVLSEHGALLGLGLGVGVLAAAVGVLPALLSPGSQIPYASLAVTLLAVLLNGLVWTWAATRFALRGRLLDALRNE